MSRVVLGDVAIEHKESCKVNRGMYPTVGLEHMRSEEITLTKWDNGGDSSFTKMFRKGNVLFGRRRAYLKKAVIAPFDGICSGDIIVIEAIPNRILPELLPLVIQNDTLFDYAIGKSAGSLSPRVKWEHLKEYEFNLPDLDRQEKLAEVLWAMVDMREAYRKLNFITNELVNAQFIEMFGDPIKNPKYQIVTIGELGEVMTGNTPSMKKAEYFESKDIMFIKPGDIAEDHVTEIRSSEVYISEKARSVGRIFPANAVLVTCIGTIGKVGISVKESSCNQQINVILPHESVNCIYLSHALYYMRTYIKKVANASVVPILNKSSFSKLHVPLPPAELQEQFAAFVHQTDKSKSELEQALSELTATYKRILSENLG